MWKTGDVEIEIASY